MVIALQAENLTKEMNGHLGVKMILLIYPPFPDHLSEYPPIGIAQLAAVLEENKIPVSLLDLGIYKLDEWKIHLKKKLDEVKPDMVGVSALTSLFNISLDILKFAKVHNPNVKTIIGGPHPTARPEEAISYDFVDYVAHGEGEMTLLELLQGKELSEIKSLSFKKDGKVIHNPKRELLQDIDILPFPARHHFNVKDYTWFPEISMITSRGCPFGCYYCFEDIFGRRFRARTPENIVAEMLELTEKYGVKRFYFYDDVFPLNKKRLMDFCQILIDRDLKYEWRCCSRVDSLDEERLAIMKKAGCYMINFGIETGDPELIQKVKKITLEKARSTIMATQKAGIEAKCYFMIGHPWDTDKSVMKTIEFAKELGADVSQFSITTPFPSTALWDMAEEMGVINEGFSDWGTFFINGDNMKDPIMKTYTLSSAKLLKFYKKAWRALYIQKAYRTLKSPTKTYKILKRRGVIPAARSLYRKIVFP